MGVGTPSDIIESVLRGVDMFDCVIPTRNARTGFLYTRKGILKLRNSRYKDDMRPIDEDCLCYTCRNFTRSYLKHLDSCKEILGLRLIPFIVILLSKIDGRTKKFNKIK